MSEKLDLNEILVIHTEDGKDISFEVVGISEDFAVLYSEDEDEFVVTDLEGNLMKDEGQAQEILNEFLAETEEPSGNGSAG